MAAAPRGGRWFALDAPAGTATTGDAAGVTSSSDVEGPHGDEWNSQRIEVGTDRAVVLLRDTDADEASADRSVVLVLDANTGELLHRIEPPDGVTYTAALPIGDVVVDLTGPASFAVDVAFAGGDRLVSRHIDRSTYLWDIAASRLVGRLWQSSPFAFFGMEVDRAANDLLQVTPEGIARIPLAPDDWFETVCSRVDRRLTDTELAAIAPDLAPGPGCPGDPGEV